MPFPVRSLPNIRLIHSHNLASTRIRKKQDKIIVKQLETS